MKPRSKASCDTIIKKGEFKIDINNNKGIESAMTEVKISFSKLQDTPGQTAAT